jgi:SLOG cluster2
VVSLAAYLASKIEPGAGRGEDPVPEGDPEVVRAALTAMRRRMRGEAQGRVVLGGRRAGFLGEIPGVMEEAVGRARRRNAAAALFGGGIRRHNCRYPARPPDR